MNRIEDIELTRILPNPINPRKNLGDLTDLVEDFKNRGFVPSVSIVSVMPENLENYKGRVKGKYKYSGNFILLAGHRRCEAAKLAGLETVSCFISEDVLDPKEQVALMLKENTNRENLSVVDEAFGYQLMLDLGDTVSEVAERTGVSESNVYKKIKVAKIGDRQTAEAAFERGATLDDIIELEKIKDPEIKKHLTNKLGTRDFTWELQNAQRKEKWEKEKTSILGMLEELGVKPNENNKGWDKGWNFYMQVNTVKDFLKIEERLREQNYNFQYTLNDGYRYFVIKEKISEVDPTQKNEPTKEQSDSNRRDEGLTKLFQQAYESRADFVCKYKYRKQDELLIMQYSMKTFIDDACSYNIMNNEYKDVFGDYSQDDLYQENSECTTIKQISEYTLKMLFALTEYRGWQWLFQCNDFDKKDGNLIELVTWYNFLQSLGYVMSTEETKLLDGSHELYIKDETDKEEDESDD